jgi:hypothetical protein
MIKLLLSIVLLVGALSAQTGFKLVDGNGKALQISAAGLAYNSTLTAATTTPTALTTTTTKVQLVHCVNNTAGAVTVTIKDASDNVYVDAVSMAGNSVFVIHYGTIGLTYTGGVKLSASANSSIKCQVEGVQ